jgi:hypothetical protein
MGNRLMCDLLHRGIVAPALDGPAGVSIDILAGSREAA